MQKVQNYKDYTNGLSLYSEIDCVCEIRFDEIDFGKILPEIIISPNGRFTSIYAFDKMEVFLISIPEQQLLETLDLSQYNGSILKMRFSVDSKYLILQYTNFFVIYNLFTQKLTKMQPFGSQLEVVHISNDEYGKLYIGIIQPYSKQKPKILICDLQKGLQLKEIELAIFCIQEIQETFSFQYVGKQCLIGHIDDSLYFLLNFQINKYLKIYPYPFSYDYAFWNVEFVNNFACIQSDCNIRIFQLFKWKQIRKIQIANQLLSFRAYLTKNDLILIVDDNTDDKNIITQEIHCFKFLILNQTNTVQSDNQTEIQSNPKILVRTYNDKFEIISYK